MPNERALESSELEKHQYELTFLRWFAVVCAVLMLLPFLAGRAYVPPGSSYLGYQYNFDDHMVYAAWMRQAMDGRFLFDNRFAIEPQPGLTIHVYFFLLGLLAKLLSIPIATAFARVGFSILFLVLLHRLLRNLISDVYAHKLALTLATFGGGIGYLVWHNFGIAITRPTPDPLAALMLNKLPTDVWQPEGYVFSSMLTNSLFMVSLCLILGAFTCVLEAKNSARAVLPGFLCMAALMNIHSYDVLLVTLCLVGLLCAAGARGQITRNWILRALAIGAGAILPALWFVYVLKHDVVFQARAATETFSPNFRQVVFGYLPLIALAFVALLRRTPGEGPQRQKWFGGVAIVAAMLAGLFFLAAGAGDKYFLSLPAWGAIALLGYLAIYLLATDEPVWNLLIAWAIAGITAPYFPALFQRKLAMGLAIPWAVLAALGLASLVKAQDRGSRNLITVLGILLLCGSSVRWLFREFQFLSNNVSNTTVHAVFLSADTEKIIRYLDEHHGAHTVVLAMPGIPSPASDQDGHTIADSFSTPYLTDLNPVLAGLTGVYAYAGHWSETPDYGARRSLATTFFLQQTSSHGQTVPVTDEERRRILKSTGAEFLVAPVPATYKGLPLADVTNLGEVVAGGTQFALIKVK